MVWFYRTLASTCFTGFPNFQSHYGLILSGGRLYSNTRIRFNPFNPTMVWFYLFLPCSSKNLISFFQSHYGLILSLLRSWRSCLSWVPFNPTMVWFYLLQVLQNFSLYMPLSIPLWSDFIRNCAFVAFVVEVRLSIPLWSDFIILSGDDYGNIFQIFQSHYGLILSRNNTKGLSWKYLPFNPTMVWFYRVATAVPTTALFLLSIPLWSDFIT